MLPDVSMVEHIKCALKLENVDLVWSARPNFSSPLIKLKVDLTGQTNVDLGCLDAMAYPSMFPNLLVFSCSYTEGIIPTF